MNSAQVAVGGRSGAGPDRRRRRARYLIAALAVVVFWLVAVGARAYDRGLDVWGPSYVSWLFSRPEVRPPPVHVVFVIADHFEPGGRPEVMSEWVNRWPLVATKHSDSSGRPPQWTWFYPVEQIRRDEVAQLRELINQGLGEIQMQLHHGHDTEATLRHKIREGQAELSAAKGVTASERQPFVFVHGNWSLDNSVCNSRENLCGANEELTVLRQEGCLADMTFPAPDRRAQPRTINSIYYAIDDSRPKSYDTGVPATVGRAGPEAGVLMIPGPLLVKWRDWRHIFYPAIEDGCIQGNNPPSPARVDAWVSAGVGVRGADDWIFIKVHLHGANDDTRPVVFGPEMHRTFEYLEKEYGDGERYFLHYARASEAVALVHALERGDPNPAAVLGLSGTQ